MASKQRSKSKKLGSSNSKAPNSPSSSTTSSSKQFLDTSIDGLSSPASSSARSKPQYSYSESLPLDAERSKENVTVTVRFRPLRCISLFQTLLFWEFLLVSALSCFWSVFGVVRGKSVKERRLHGMRMVILSCGMSITHQ